MKKARLRMAALAIGGALTLLAPVTAAARDRDDFQNNDRSFTPVEQNWNRDGDRFDRADGYNRDRRDRDRARNNFRDRRDNRGHERFRRARFDDHR